MTFPTISAVLFDLDDTLLDHRGAARDALTAWTGSMGVTGALADLETEWLRIETIHYRRYQARELTNLEHRRARVREFLPHLDLADDAAADAAFLGYWDAYRAAWRTFDDAVDAIERARHSGLAVGILTNGDAVAQGLKIETTALAGLDLKIFASSELPAAKPHPSAFLSATAALGVAPECCLMVGDSLENDIFGARGAGLPAVFLDRTGAIAAEGPRVRSLRDIDFGALNGLFRAA